MSPLAQDVVRLNLEHLILGAVLLALCSSALVAVWQELLDRAWERRAERRARAADPDEEPLPEHTTDEDPAPVEYPPIPREYDHRPLASLLEEYTQTDRGVLVVDPPPSTGPHLHFERPAHQLAVDRVAELAPADRPGWVPPTRWGKTASGLHRYDCPTGLTITGLPQLVTAEQAEAYAEQHLLWAGCSCRPLADLEVTAEVVDDD